MATPKILVVDDDKNLLELLKMRLENAGYEVVTAFGGEDALRAASEQVLDLAIVDLQLVNTDGISLMQELHAVTPEMPAIILTAHGSIESAVEAMRKGAYNYLTKPFQPEELVFQIERALENQRLNIEIRMLRELVKERYEFSNIIARSEKMQTVLEQVARVSRTESTVYIHGESGTGKELIAKAIHLSSDRKEQPFVAINCAAIPETLLESELFGHEKGSYTGAVKSSKGLFVEADKGTIFLDEIGDMPLMTQAKLLRVLQERQFYPVGSQKPVEVDVRVVVATNKDLEAEVKKGSFREDLFYRIHVIPIFLPPLRERKDDIPYLVDHFLKKFNQQMKKAVKSLTPLAMQKLRLHDWPGNVRELENVIEYAVAMAQQDIITDDLILQTRDITVSPLLSLREAREDFERSYLIRILESTKGNVSKAAQLAGKYRADFYNLLKKYNLKPEIFKKD